MKFLNSFFKKKSLEKQSNLIPNFTEERIFVNNIETSSEVLQEENTQNEYRNAKQIKRKTSKVVKQGKRK